VLEKLESLQGSQTGRGRKGVFFIPHSLGEKESPSKEGLGSREMKEWWWGRFRRAATKLRWNRMGYLRGTSWPGSPAGARGQGRPALPTKAPGHRRDPRHKGCTPRSEFTVVSSRLTRGRARRAGTQPTSVGLSSAFVQGPRSRLVRQFDAEKSEIPRGISCSFHGSVVVSRRRP